MGHPRYIYTYIWDDQSGRKTTTFLFHKGLLVHNEDVIFFIVHSTHIELTIHYGSDNMSNINSI